VAQTPRLRPRVFGFQCAQLGYPGAAVAESPAPFVLRAPLLPLLVALSLLGAWLAWRAYRGGAASARAALLQGSLPAALWVLAASLNPERPTQLVLTPFGIGLLLGFGVGLQAARTAALRTGCAEAVSLSCFLWSCAGALAGARLLYAAGHLAGFATLRELLALHAGGLSLSGALLAGVAVSGACFRARRLRWRAWLESYS
jgi:hypothetical protein